MMSIRSVDLKTCQGNDTFWKFECSLPDPIYTMLFIAVREVFVEKSINESSATQFSPVTSAVFRTAGGNMQERATEFEKFSLELMYRVVRLNFTPEIKVFYMLLDRYLPIFTMTSLKQHMKYFNFRC